MPVLFLITLFLSSGLLFLIQPMFARMVLPLLGGTPAVWNTCMVFFQAALLVGYLYAHLSTRWLGVRKQAMLHCGVLFLPLLVMPLAVSQEWSPPAGGNPIGWLLLVLTVSIGLPFFVVSSSAPLLQKWFSATGHHTARDPYYLYAASNLGSMLALLAYPVIVEPLLRLGEQSRLWSGGYLLLIGLVLSCAIGVIMRGRTPGETPDHPKQPKGDAPDPAEERPLTWKRRLRWIALAAAPSSLMLGVTTFISTDISVVPLLWVIPLALYLLTFILVFARRKLLPHRLMVRIFPVAAVVLLIMLLGVMTRPLLLILSIHLLVFFIATMVCHGELAGDRPNTTHLTEFYLLMSVGGVLGGMFNALLAPLIFTGIAEYPIALVAVCLLSPPWRMKYGLANFERAFFPGTTGSFFFFARHWKRLADVILPVILCGITFLLVFGADETGFSTELGRLGMIAGGPAIVCLFFLEMPLRFGLSIAAVLIAGSFSTANHGVVLDAHRSFFGVHRVTRRYYWFSESDPGYRLNMFLHGTTVHGIQLTDFQTRQPIAPDSPIGYYHPQGPIGQIFQAGREREDFDHIGMVGLGVGGLLAYGKPGDRIQCYEIDPVVQMIAEDTRYFTFLSAALKRGVEIEIKLGDARLILADAENDTLDILIIDAFSSDSIPVHLLTSEAIDLYLSKLTEDGFLVFHITNRHLDLRPVMANLAAEAGLVCAIWKDNTLTDVQLLRQNRYHSTWAVMARQVEDLASLKPDGIDSPWILTRPDPSRSVWTDDYSNIFSVFAW